MRFAFDERLRASLLGVLLCAGCGEAGAQMAADSASRHGVRAVAQRSADAGEVAQLVARYTNELRAAHGLAPTAGNEPLARAASYFADYMARTDRHAHDADGRTPPARAKQHGYAYCIVSENIAMQFHSAGFATDDLAQRFVEGWRNSPGHRKNMLDADVTETGVAVARSARTGRYYAVQMFGRPRSAMYSFQIENRSGDPVRYRFAGEILDLPPRTTRTHEHCRPAELVVPGTDGFGIRPADGDRFVVARDREALRLHRQ